MLALFCVPRVCEAMEAASARPGSKELRGPLNAASGGKKLSFSTFEKVSKNGI